jgi:predicted adenine nucleotide alpha hydrolase (AANH) superfamily ATPase
MKLLLHTCCAPCALGAVQALQMTDIGMADNSLYFYNPNIQPLTEHEARLSAFKEVVLSREYLNDIDNYYCLEKWQEEARNHSAGRCDYCYRSRLEKTAIKAAEEGFTAFSTTLLISPYQKHEEIRRIGEELGKEYSIQFFYEDMRPFFRAGQREAKELGIYMQKYCGCLDSKEEA